MKVLFAAYRHDPLDSSSTTGADHQFFSALLKHGGQVRSTEPVEGPPNFIERIFRKAYRRFSNKRYAKYPLSFAWRASKKVNQAAQQWKPNVVFTLYPATLGFYRSDVPCILRTDATFLGMHKQGKQFLRHDKLGLSICVWLEKRAFRHCRKIVTHSEWSKHVLVEKYRIEEKRIDVIPNPGSIPFVRRDQVTDIPIVKRTPLQLLFVGNNGPRKGVDLAIQIVKMLKNRDIAASLTICGLKERDQPSINYVGRFDKTIPQQYEQYIGLFQRTHFLLHPTRFDPSPRVTSEAAAFGVPTITNDVGGMATSVKHNESGLLLPAHSSPSAYVDSIVSFVKNPDRYIELRRKTRARYERELNWNAAGKRLADVCEEVLQ